ncbi:hypothetical protein AMTRI_Chr09g42170 [Amborella trichopoda]
MLSFFSVICRSRKNKILNFFIRPSLWSTLAFNPQQALHFEPKATKNRPQNPKTTLFKPQEKERPSFHSHSLETEDPKGSEPCFDHEVAGLLEICNTLTMYDSSVWVSMITAFKLNPETVRLVLGKLQGNVHLAMDFFKCVQLNSQFQCSIGCFSAMVSLLLREKMFSECLPLLRELALLNYSPRRVLESLSTYDPDPLIFSLLMEGYTQVKMPNQAITVFQWLLDSGHHPNASSCCNLILCLLKSNQVDIAWKVYMELQTIGIYISNSHTLNALICALCKEGHVQRAHLVFLAASSRSLVLDISLCNPILSCYVQKGLTRQAFCLFGTILQKGIEPNSETYAIFIGEFVELGDLGQAKIFFDRMLAKGLVPSCKSYMNLIYMQIWQGFGALAMELIKELIEKYPSKSSVHFLGDLLECLYVDGRREAGNQLLCWLIKLGLGSAVKSCHGEFKINNSKQRAVHNCNREINRLSREGKLEEARKIFYKMAYLGLVPNIFTYNTIIEGYCKEGNLSRAYKLCDEMLLMGVETNIGTYTSLISGLEREGKMKDALELVHMLSVRGLIPNLQICNILVEGLRKRGDVEEALVLYYWLQESLLVPDFFISQSLLVSLCTFGRMEDANKLFQRITIRCLLQDEIGFGLVSNWAIRGYNLENAFKLYGIALGRGFLPDVFTFSILISGLDKHNKLTDSSIVVTNSIVYSELALR